jgi:hypothetical protein
MSQPPLTNKKQRNLDYAHTANIIKPSQRIEGVDKLGTRWLCEGGGGEVRRYGLWVHQAPPSHHHHRASWFPWLSGGQQFVSRVWVPWVQSPPSTLELCRATGREKSHWLPIPKSGAFLRSYVLVVCLAHSPPPPSATCLSFLSLSVCRRSTLLTGEGVGSVRGAKSCDREISWPSIIIIQYSLLPTLL